MVRQLFCLCPDRQGPQTEGDLTFMACFALRGLMLKHQVQGGQTGRGVSQGASLCNDGRQSGLIHAFQGWVDQPANSACWALRASSRSTDFIMEDGVVSAFFFCTVR